MGRPHITPLVGAGLVTRRVRVHPREVVFVKGILEASEGLAAVFAEAGGDLTLATSASQIGELDRLLVDLSGEIRMLVEPA